MSILKINKFDLEEFFNDKYRYLNNNLGVGATSIITESQMITRFYNDPQKPFVSNFEILGGILCDVFDFNPDLFLRFGYSPELYEKLDENHKSVLNEIVVVEYVNNIKGNYILIYLPSKTNTLTQEQFDAINYISECVDNIKYKLKMPIQVMATDRKRSAQEFNSLKYNILPFLKDYIDEKYKQSIPDCNIIASDDLKVKVFK